MCTENAHSPSPVLPSGMQKISKVGSNSGGGNTAVTQAMLAGITGIDGGVDPNRDYAYSTVARVSIGLKQKYDGENLPSTFGQLAEQARRLHHGYEGERGLRRD